MYHVQNTGYNPADQVDTSDPLKRNTCASGRSTDEAPILKVSSGRGAQIKSAKFKIANMVEVMGWKAVGAKLVDFSKSVEMEWEKKMDEGGQGALFE